MESNVILTPESLQTRRAQMFPVLSDVQVARIARVAAQVDFAPGSLVFGEGDTQTPFFVVLDGEIEVLAPHGAMEAVITVHRRHEFTGEVTLLTGRRALVQGRARTQTRVLRLEPAQFRSIVQTDAELSEIIMRAFILRRMGLFLERVSDVVVLGSRHSATTLRLQEFLTRNGCPHRYTDIDSDPDVQALLDGFHVSVADIPVLIFGESVLRNPSNAQVAECLGLNAPIASDVLLDVVIVGAGPAGLAAAVYAASEGLEVLVVEATAPGGQAGTSSKIENYLGFPTGISGQALAQRALIQAEKFGARLSIARSAVELHCDGLPYQVELEGGEIISARAIVIATGAEYRRLEIPNLDRYEGVGVYYGATYIEAQRCTADEVIVVGGGNSAGQAATFLSQTSQHVHMLIRGHTLAASMSRYLIRRIEDTPNITLHTNTRIVSLGGDSSVEEVTWDTDGVRTSVPIRHVFSMTGAKPNTDWLRGCLQLDDKGFVITGVDLGASNWAKGAARPSYQFETSQRNVFAVGDVRAGSVKRVASSVGEGSACVQVIHRAIAE
jgi:thioredoxin reductase (NADPH)